MMFTTVLRLLYEKWCTKHSAVQYTGCYDSWDSAREKSTGYGTDNILNKVEESILIVKEGKANYERDGVLFYEKKYNYPLMLHICGIAKEYNNIFNVIDWGGSLGSTYFQNRKLIEDLNIIYQWTVVEQEHFVTFGKAKLCDEHLNFEYNLQTVKNIEKYNCILLGSVLQYIDFADELLEQVVKLEIPYIIIERTPFGNKDYYVIEKVRQPIYDATYPLHVIDQKNLFTFLNDHGYDVLDEWKSDIDSPIRINSNVIEYMSYVFKRGEKNKDYGIS